MSVLAGHDLAGEILMAGIEIAVVREQPDLQDVLDVCETILGLVSKLNEQINGDFY